MDDCACTMRLDGYKFGYALNDLLDGWILGIRLPKWSEDVVIKIKHPDENSKMTAPYLYVESRFGCVPWIPTQIEMLSEEWVIIPNIK